MERDKSIFVEGPLGGGLEIPKDFSGTNVIICGGTGVLPFVDFLELLYFKVVYEILKSKNPEAADVLTNFLGVNLASFFSGDLNVTLYGAFRSEDEAYGLELIKRLSNASDAHGKKMFTASVTCSADKSMT